MIKHSFLSPAKLNLFLLITAKRPDGYHDLQTLFQFIDWCDTLTIGTSGSSGPIRLENSIAGVPTEDNLIYKAAALLKETTGCDKDASISIEKQLPMGGGIGGGSSNAATALVALNHLWETDLSEDELASLGNRLGADIPVFVRGRAALAEGTGDILTPVDIPQPWYLIIHPNCHVETAALFRDKYLTRNSNPIKLRAVLEGPLSEIGHNDFEPVARRLFPEVDKALSLLSQYGNAKLTGTGACIFCSFPDKESALAAEAEITAANQEQTFNTRVAAGLNTSPLFSGILKR